MDWTVSALIGIMFGLVALVIVSAEIVAVLAVISLLWAPFGAFIAARTARLQGLPPGRSALVGGLYSALFIAPWGFLMLTMRGKHLHGGRVTMVFFLLHIIWLVGLFGIALVTAWPFATPEVPEVTGDPTALFVFNTIVIGVLWGVSIYITANLPAVEISKNTTIQKRYVLPFALCYVSLILAAITLVIGR